MEPFIRNVTFDASDARALAAFWAAALGWEHRGTMVVPRDGGGPRLNFEGVPEPKSVKNRLHLDVNVDDRERHIERLQALGATRLRDVDAEDGSFSWTVMQDPEGNEFCVVALPAL